MSGVSGGGGVGLCMDIWGWELRMGVWCRFGYGAVRVVYGCIDVGLCIGVGVSVAGCVQCRTLHLIFFNQLCRIKLLLLMYQCQINGVGSECVMGG